jgi:diadenosine tetraphosphate (Ap4A) HIT family hydrolase
MTKSCMTLDLDAFESTKTVVQADPAAGQGKFQTHDHVAGRRPGSYRGPVLHHRDR